ncbi:unnamed protein product [Phaeothamnion confervicola]
MAVLVASSQMPAAEAAPSKPARLPSEFETPQLRGLGGDDNPRVPPFQTLPSGVRFTDLQEGTGPAVEEGKSLSCQWVLRRMNGYFVDSSAANNYDPFLFRVGDTRRVIRGVDVGVRGMRQGGKRRLIVPPDLAYVGGVGDDKPGPVPTGFGPRRQITNRKNEPLLFDIEVTRVR